jgi:hypothetical protein
MSKHTPGPWTVRCLDETDEEYRVEAASTLFVDISPCSDGYTPGQTKFNARLIAAAPDLLAACEKFVSYYPRGINPDLDDGYLLARAAIAKSEGEPCPPN